MITPRFIQKDVPLAKHSTLNVGGRARCFSEISVGVFPPNWGGVCVANEELKDSLKFVKDNSLEFSIVGSGSNVLFGDNGFPGLVIRSQASGNSIEFETGKEKLWVSAGVSVSKLVQDGKIFGLGGFEFLSGLPGTVGGAIYGNSGCYGGQFWDVVDQVVFFDGESIQIVFKQDMHFANRWSFFKDKPSWVILGAKIRFYLRGKSAVTAESHRIQQKRQRSQPKERSVGCIFRNPEMVMEPVNLGAGSLIDRCELKGTRVGGAMVSHDHANFFVNTGGASANDFIELIRLVKGRVFEEFGVLLEEEIIRIGEF